MSNQSNPTFVVYCGAMFSSKTSKLLMALERFKHQGRKVVVFKPFIDDRFSVNEVVSHSGWRHPAKTIKEGTDIIKILNDEEEVPEVVAIDEAFMVPGVADVLIWLFRTGISVVVSTLDLSFSAKPFKEVERLLPHATYVEKCAAVCTECGQDAYYTYKKPILNDNEITIGGAELYESRCFSHHPFIDNRTVGDK